MSDVAPFCYVCRRTDRALRPYGKGGKPICLPCMEGNPERLREGRKRMRRKMKAAGAVPIIGGPDGPVAPESLTEEERAALIYVDTRTRRIVPRDRS